MPTDSATDLASRLKETRSSFCSRKSAETSINCRNEECMYFVSILSYVFKLPSQSEKCYEL